MDAKAIAALAAVAAEAAPQGGTVKSVVPGLTLHVDGDMVCYYFAGGEETTPGEARRLAMNGIARFKAACGAEKVVVHMTNRAGNKGERYLIATVKKYQGQRTGAAPKNHAYLCEVLSSYVGDAFTVKVWANREADDGMCACAYHAIRSGKGPGYAAIATRDKDMRMFPGMHVNWLTLDLLMVEDNCFYKTGADGKIFGYKWFWLQMLMGDTADNIPGLPEYCTTNAKKQPCVKLCGEKTAEKLLEKCKTNQQCFDEVYGLYQEYYVDHLGQSYEDADDRFLEQVALLWMRSGAKASVDDFFDHVGLDIVMPAELVGPARARLVLRVMGARRALNALSS